MPQEFEPVIPVASLDQAHPPVVSSEDDSWWLVASNPTYQVTIPSTSTDVDMDIVDYDWVGQQDSIDFRQIRVDMAGEYTFQLNGLSNKAVLTIYSNDTKKIQKVTGKAGKSVSTKGLFLLPGVYYISVEAPGWKKNQNTGYNVSVAGQVFNRGNNHDDVPSNLAPEYRVSIDGTNPAVAQTLVADEWVGYGDAVDYRQVTVTTPGQYSFNLGGLNGKAKLTLYSSAMKKIKSVTASAGKTGVIKDRFLSAGTYYISVEAPGWKKGQSSDYNVTVTGTAYNRGDNSDDTLTTAKDLDLSSGVLSDWVGFGDAIDYRKFTLSDTRTLSFVLSGSAKMAKMTLSRLDGNGKLKTVKKTTIAANGLIQWNNLELGPANYYLAVESADKGKGKKNTDYSLNIAGYESAAPQVAALSLDAGAGGIDLGNWQQLPELGWAASSLTESAVDDSIARQWGTLIG